MNDSPNELARQIPAQAIPALFVIVCTRFHDAYGVFTAPQEALAESDRLNANATHGCSYIPIPLLIVNGQYVTHGETPGITGVPRHRRNGGYL
jgi:hypothetical protein